MKRFPVPGSVALVLPLAFCGLLTTQSVPAYAAPWKLPSHLPEFLLFSAQGYLGVDLGSVDAERANALHLKDTHAAEVVLVDHDAPAAKSGVKVHDVILLLNGRPFDNVDQLRRSLHEMAPGRSVTLLVSRDGAPVSMTVQLCNRAELQHNSWISRHLVPQPALPAAGSTFLGNAPSGPSAFLDAMLPHGLYIGAEVNPVRAQLAGYFGVQSGTGLLVESVYSQSPAARAGLKAGDVVVKVEAKQMTSRNDWAKAMRTHRGKPVQLTVMRNKQVQLLTMSAGRAKRD